MPTGRSRSCFAFFAIPFFTINKKTTKQNKTKFWKIFSTEEHWCERKRKKMPVITRKIVNQGIHNLFSPYRRRHFADSVRLCRFNTNTATTLQNEKKSTEKRTFQTIA